MRKEGVKSCLGDTLCTEYVRVTKHAYTCVRRDCIPAGWVD
jgi:hypothetical protein